MGQEFEENFAKPSCVWSFNLSQKKGKDWQRTIVFYKFPWRASSEVRDQFLLHANTNKHTYPALYKYIFRFGNTVVYIIVSWLWSGYSGQILFLNPHTSIGLDRIETYGNVPSNQALFRLWSCTGVQYCYCDIWMYLGVILVCEAY